MAYKFCSWVYMDKPLKDGGGWGYMVELLILWQLAYIQILGSHLTFSHALSTYKWIISGMLRLKIQKYHIIFEPLLLKTLYVYLYIVHWDKRESLC